MLSAQPLSASKDGTAGVLLFGLSGMYWQSRMQKTLFSGDDVFSGDNVIGSNLITLPPPVSQFSQNVAPDINPTRTIVLQSKYPESGGSASVGGWEAITEVIDPSPVKKIRKLTTITDGSHGTLSAVYLVTPTPLSPTTQSKWQQREHELPDPQTTGKYRQGDIDSSTLVSPEVPTLQAGKSTLSENTKSQGSATSGEASATAVINPTATPLVSGDLTGSGRKRTYESSAEGGAGLEVVRPFKKSRRISDAIKKKASDFFNQLKVGISCARNEILMLANEFTCLVVNGDSMEQIGLNEDLVTAFQRLWLPQSGSGLSPPYDDTLSIGDWLSNLNQDLWQRLQLDSLGTIYCDQKSALCDRYLQQYDEARNKLSRQPAGVFRWPQMEVLLTTSSGQQFKLSDLPREWLQSSQIVQHISSLAPVNSRLGLQRALATLELAREIFFRVKMSGMPNQREREEYPKVFKDKLTQLYQENLVDLNAFSSEGLNIAELAIEYGAKKDTLYKLHTFAHIQFSEQQLGRILQQGAENTSNPFAGTYHQLEDFFQLLMEEKTTVTLSQVAINGQDLLSYAIERRAGIKNVEFILDPDCQGGRGGVAPEIKHIEKLLQQDVLNLSSVMILNSLLGYLAKPERLSEWRNKSGQDLVEWTLSRTDRVPNTGILDQFYRVIRPKESHAELVRKAMESNKDFIPLVEYIEMYLEMYQSMTQPIKPDD